MDHRQVVRVLASGRAVVGLALVVAPGVVGRRWLGDVAADGRVRLALRGLGARDLALAAGTLQALDRGTSVRPWAAMSAVGDASDALGATLAWPTLGASRALLTVLTAGSAALLGALAAPELD